MHASGSVTSHIAVFRSNGMARSRLSVAFAGGAAEPANKTLSARADARTHVTDMDPPRLNNHHTSRTATSAWRPALAREATPKVAATALVPSPDRFTVLNTLNSCTITSARRSPANRIGLLARTSTLLKRVLSIDAMGRSPADARHVFTSVRSRSRLPWLRDVPGT